MSYYNDADNSEILILELTKTVSRLKEENNNLKQELEAQTKLPVPKSVVKQFLEMQAIIQKLESDLTYYKKYVPVQIIINKENKEKPTRKGGLPR
jgi:predicted RNase H-like nuclease (RuvC/YqgF family)